MLHILAAVIALSDPTGPVVDARIAEVIADPERYSGQTLRIRGQIDACYSFVCSICPEEMTPQTAVDEECLRISFDGFMSEEDRNGPVDAPYTPSPWRDVEELFRYSVVTAEGVFDPECLTGRPWPPEPPVEPAEGEVLIDEIICMDRASTYRAVQVRTVHRRILSNQGLVFGRDGGALTPAPTEIAAPVEAAYRTYLATFDDDPDVDPMTVLLPEFPDFKPAGEEARLCICLKGDCTGEWPTRDISVWGRTNNDPYRCYAALQVAGVWRVYPE